MINKEKTKKVATRNRWKIVHTLLPDNKDKVIVYSKGADSAMFGVSGKRVKKASESKLKSIQEDEENETNDDKPMKVLYFRYFSHTCDENKLLVWGSSSVGTAYFYFKNGKKYSQVLIIMINFNMCNVSNLNNLFQRSREEVLSSRVDEYARMGLRILVMGMRVMSRSDFDEWFQKKCLVWIRFRYQA